MATRYHMCLDIRGALRNGSYKRDLVGACRDEATGRKLTADEIFEELTNALAEGKRVIPMSACDNFDFQKGCGGHPIESEMTSPPLAAKPTS